MNIKELVDHACQYFGRPEEIYTDTYQWTESSTGKSVIMEIDGHRFKFYSQKPGTKAVYETGFDIDDIDELVKDTLISKLKFAFGVNKMEENQSVADKMLAERFFESEEYNKMYSNVATYDNEDHTSWEEAKKVINRDLTGKPKHDIFKNETDMSGKKVCSTNPPKSTTPQNNQAGSPYHEATILKADEIKKLEEEVEADKKLLMSKLKENMEASDLFIVLPKNPYTYDFSDFEDFKVRVDGITGYTMRADDVNSILTVGEVDPEDVDVYECPDYIAESEDPCPEVSDIHSLQKIYDVYSFFDL